MALDAPKSTAPPVGEPAKDASTGWRLDVQGMRGLTILVIVLYHAQLHVPGGFVAVDAFFVISGFVITGMVLREVARTGGFSLRTFYLRRMKRLTPALMATVSCVLVLGVALTSPIAVQDHAALTGIGAVFFSANAVVQMTTGSYFGPWAELNPLMHVWSLSLEEQFYLVFPIILSAGLWVASRRWLAGPMLLMGIVFVMSLWFALFGVTALPSVNPAVFGYFSPVGRTWEFAAGSLLAIATQRGLALSRRRATPIAIAGLLLFFVPMWLIDSSVQYPGPWTLAPVTATLLLIVAGFQPDNPMSRLLSSRPMVFAGDRSYSWYLWHWPVIVFVLAAFPGVWGIGVIGALLSIGPALLNYRYVELWSRRAVWTNRTIVKRVVVMAAATLSLSGFVLLGSASGWWNNQIADARAAVLEDHVAKANGCHIYTPVPTETYDLCWLQTAGDGRPLALVGDSNADHLSDAFVAAGEQLGRPVNVVSASSCPFIALDAPTNDAASTLIEERCREYIDTTMTWLRAQAPMTVAISTSGSLYDVDDGSLLADTVRAMVAMGHEVVLVKPVPFFFDDGLQHGTWDPSACTTWNIVNGSCSDVITVDEARVRQGAIWDGLASAAQQSGVSVLDLSPELCPNGVCQTNPDGRWAYRDFNHLTASESRRLADVVARGLDRAKGARGSVSAVTKARVQASPAAVPSG